MALQRCEGTYDGYEGKSWDYDEEEDYSLPEVTVSAGNAAWKVWKALPEPKMSYIDWYYEKRFQSLSEALEGVYHENCGH